MSTRQIVGVETIIQYYTVILPHIFWKPSKFLKVRVYREIERDVIPLSDFVDSEGSRGNYDSESHFNDFQFTLEVHRKTERRDVVVLCDSMSLTGEYS